MPPGLFGIADDHCVKMQNGSGIKHIHGTVGRTELENGLGDPAFQLVALFGTGDILVIFDIIKDSQVWTVRTMATTSDFLAGTEALHLDVIAR